MPGELFAAVVRNAWEQGLQIDDTRTRTVQERNMFAEQRNMVGRNEFCPEGPKS
jgi:hypothetical protein